MALSDDAYLAVSNISSWKRNLAKSVTILAVTCAEIAALFSISSTSVALLTAPSIIPVIDPSLEHIISSGVTIYDVFVAINQIAAVADEFPEIWTNRGITVDISEAEWMPIPLKSDAVSKPSRVYSIDLKDREVIDEAFNKLYAQDKIT